MTELWGILLDTLLGSRCLICGERVFPRDRSAHAYWEHGDEPETT
jgi:hypothetical protein